MFDTKKDLTKIHTQGYRINARFFVDCCGDRSQQNIFIECMYEKEIYWQYIKDENGDVIRFSSLEQAEDYLDKLTHYQELIKPSVKKSEVVIKEQDQIYYPLPSKNIKKQL